MPGNAGNASDASSAGNASSAGTSRPHGQGNLPTEATSFVGRTAELAELGRLLTGYRLVTLTGVGGVGKSRLALHAGARAQADEAEEAFRDGVWLVELSPLQDSTLLAHTVAGALRLSDATARPALEVLGEWLADKALLLILDTCEHLLDGCTRLVESLLSVAPGLRVLATSRQPLGIAGERVLAVPPLPTEKDAAAVRLFTDRAAAASPGFVLPAGDRQAVAAVTALCRDLDGLPLAIELAAGQLHAMSLEQLTDRLRVRFDTLTPLGRPRPALPRHQTMRTTIGWSHELCTPLERLLWARLSVFAGGFDEEAAQLVCAGGPLADKEIPAVLRGLVDKSVVQPDQEGPRGPRYRLLDTIREYGTRWLRELDEYHTLQRRHRDHFLAATVTAGDEWTSAAQIQWYGRMTTDHANLRAALDFCLTEPDHSALELAGGLWFFWFACGYPSEGRSYLERALARDPAPTPERAQALWACALVTFSQGEGPAAEEYANESLDLARHLGDPAAIARAGHSLAASRTVQGKQEAAARALDQIPYVPGLTGSAEASRLLAQATRGFVHVNSGEFDQAAEVADTLRTECMVLGDRWCRAYADYVRALADLARGLIDSAVEYARESLRSRRLLHDTFGIAMNLDLLASAAAAAGDGARAGRLLGVGQRVWLTFGLAQLGMPELAAARAECERQARATTGDRAYEAAFAAGLDTDMAAGMAFALGD
ncbi:ATP-binding protein [Streptomyces boninensis]|uniref:ATP-binding protein n=1 Tax=Streptomyces boninensis TaxID=2039455 RepID=UPI003B227B68